MEWVRGEVIGRGSFGTVNLATTTDKSSIIVKSSHISNSSSLQNEKEILIDLGIGHQNIVKYLGDSISYEKGTQVYNIFLEYASKGSLLDHRKNSGGKFVISDVKKYTRDILNGLCYVHEAGFVHCDVKLQNILVFEDEVVKLADFGLARVFNDQDCENNNDFKCQLRGTPLYMSPEVVSGEKVVSPAADIWAVGCAVVEMLTGKSVWECLPENDVSGLLYRIGVLGEIPRIPNGLCNDAKDFLNKCFLKDPNERWTAFMLLNHPFLSGCNDRDFSQKNSVSPKCPFEFPDWESVENSSFESSSIESDFLCLRSISSRFENELNCCLVPDWIDSNEWVIIR